MALNTALDSTPNPSVCYGESSASGAQPSTTTSTDQNTGTVRCDERSEDRTYAGCDSNNDDIGDDVVVRGDNADENQSRTPELVGEVRDAQQSITEQHVPRRISKKTTLSEHPVAVTTQEALDGYREKTMRVAIVENNAGALDSEPDVIIGSDKGENRRCKKKDKDHMKFLCELYETQRACGRYFVRELTSEVNSRRKCVTNNIMAMPERDNSGGSLHVWVGFM